jgi:uncharacterized membrane protein
MNLRLLAHVGFWVGMVTMYWDFFQTVLDAKDTPFRLHHYYVGLILAAAGYFVLTRNDWLKLCARLREKVSAAP